MKVGYLGPESSFSHIAAEKVFPKEELISVGSIVKLFDMVEAKELARAIIPMENNTGGSVAITLDELLEKEQFIVGDHYSAINYCFLSKNKENIAKIYSHPQGFLQCKEWLKNNYPDAELIECGSNSEAAKLASETGDSALAGKIAGQTYGLELITQNINDSSNNETRFIIVSKEQLDPKGGEKTSCFFALKNKPGALLDSLQPLKENNINMTKLESRPSKEVSWDYIFFIEFVGNLFDEKVQRSLEEIKKYTTHVKILGSYSKL
ncbi:MAG: prephenate dehydratase [Candidatus Diapherotrites archaeon]|uniref:prephenate dehydratase n=1 Tax=Candidatus Iainarchaeum sp. TaxID=3101447 RepID=A0A8T5GEI1_9ARCH|nr:prephenate dehydratase [Candidatus Diapherotrites archaeon]MBT7241216.1 prephenate dehydratase [Candidatus Diapherotrites archaeon]